MFYSDLLFNVQFLFYDLPFPLYVPSHFIPLSIVNILLRLDSFFFCLLSNFLNRPLKDIKVHGVFYVSLGESASVMMQSKCLKFYAKLLTPPQVSLDMRLGWHQPATVTFEKAQCFSEQ